MPLFTNHPVMDIEFIDFLLSCLSWSDISTFLLQKLRKGQIPPDGAIQKHRMQHQKSMEPSFEPTRPTPSPREPRQQEPMELKKNPTHSRRDLIFIYKKKISEMAKHGESTVVCLRIQWELEK